MKRMMTVWLLILWTACSLTMAQAQEKETLHVVSCFAKKDRMLGGLIGMTQVKFKRWVKRINKQTDLVVKTYDCSGNDFGKENILSKLEEVLAVAKPNDAILFYYMGHGFRYEDQTDADQWPQLLAGNSETGWYAEEDYYTMALHAKEIKEKLDGANVRLTLGIVEACNNTLEGVLYRPNLASLHPGIDPFKEQKIEAERYQELYTKARGHIWVGSASPHELSRLDERYGGLFFYALWKAHEEATTSFAPAHWEELLASASQHFKTLTKELYKEEVHPQIVTDLMGVKAVEIPPQEDAPGEENNVISAPDE